MWVDSLRGQIVGLDTAPLVYYIEENPRYYDTLAPFFQAVETGQCQAITSVVTLLEVLVYPTRNQDSVLADRYRQALTSDSGIVAYPVTSAIAEEAALIRAVFNRVRTPDAIQLATATVGGARYFLTNDIALPDLPSLRRLLINDLAQG